MMKAQDLEGLPSWIDFECGDYIGNKQLEEDASDVRRWPLFKELLDTRSVIRKAGVEVNLSDSVQPVAV